MERILQLIQCAPLQNMIEYTLAKVRLNGHWPEDEYIKGELPDIGVNQKIKDYDFAPSKDRDCKDHISFRKKQTEDTFMHDKKVSLIHHLNELCLQLWINWVKSVKRRNGPVTEQ